MITQDLLALAERCEKATGPDRELDALIEKSLPPTDRHFAANALPQARTLHNQRSARFYGARIGMNDSDGDYQATRYTASLDAAMTLVPEGSVWAVESDRGAFSGWCYDKEVHNTGPRIAFTPALALTAAALRARAAMESANG